MGAFLAPKTGILGWIRELANNHLVLFPQRTGSASYQFEAVNERSQLDFEDFDSPVPRPGFRASSNGTPPGKALLPAREELFRFRRSEDGRIEFFPTLDDRPRILAGVRPCDLKAIHLMDLVFDSGQKDSHYLTRRSHTAIIAHDCLQPCDEHCFCDAAGSLRSRDGADVFLTPLEGEILVQCLSDRGEELVANAGFTPCDDAESRLAWAEAQRAQPFGRQLPVSVDELPEIIARQWDSNLWHKHSERCFSCGTCNLVCPTCYCFDVRDDLQLKDPSGGVRERHWDGCMLPDFAEVAGGHNFRGEATARQRHRVKRKFEYLTKRFGLGSFCVGCGRCGHQCTAGIDIYDIVKDLAEAGA